MKKSTEQIINKALLPTVLCAVVFSVASAVSFEFESAGDFSYFALTIAIIAWICLIIEFILVYETLVDKWFSKDHSLIASLWFLASIYIAIILTPDKAVDVRTFVILIAIFASVFCIPYYIGVRYCKGYYEKFIAKYFKKKENPVALPVETTNKDVADTNSDARKSVPTELLFEKNADTDEVCSTYLIDEHATEPSKEEVVSNDPTVSSPLNAKLTQEEEAKVIDDMVAALPKEQVESLPIKLQVNNCLFLLVMFREEGYLDSQFKPVITTTYKDGSVEINQTLYAYIANIICTVLNIKQGKWVIFEEFWNIKNAAQLLHNFNASTEDSSNEHQVRISKMLRRATRLRPKLESVPLRGIIDKH